MSLKLRVKGIGLSSLLALLVILPPCDCRLDIFLLTLLGTAAKQQNQTFTILAKVDPVTGAEIQLVFEYAGPKTLYVRKVACDIRMIAVAVFAAAGAFRSSNHCE